MQKIEKENIKSITSEEIEKCIAILSQLVANTDEIFDIEKAQRTELIKVAGLFSRPDRDEFSRRKKDGKKVAKRILAAKEKTARKETGIRNAREASVFVAPKLLPIAHLADKEQKEFESHKNCYVCKTPFIKVHHFYDSMCPDCGDFNYAKRFQTANVSGQIAVITGSRLKIGYHITLMLLRGGATVVATTRFPVDSALRFSQEADFAAWGHRLKIHGLDLRHIPSVEIFCNFVEQKYGRLDILINNAAQTVRRPSGFYQHLMKNEESPIASLPKNTQDLLFDHWGCLQELSALTAGASSNQNMPVTWHGPEPGIGLRASAKLSQIPYSFDKEIVTTEVFPEGKLDADLQQVDLRKTNSWRLKLGEIETTEMIEV
ncbi:MAG: SDR family oxidoreductase, partial [Lutibacter sp.]|nr:SDR family oxidoreductase [Lutibacter sp.]